MTLTGLVEPVTCANNCRWCKEQVHWPHAERREGVPCLDFCGILSGLLLLEQGAAGRSGLVQAVAEEMSAADSQVHI